MLAKPCLADHTNIALRFRFGPVRGEAMGGSALGQDLAQHVEGVARVAHHLGVGVHVGPRRAEHRPVFQGSGQGVADASLVQPAQVLVGVERSLARPQGGRAAPQDPGDQVIAGREVLVGRLLGDPEPARHLTQA